MIWCLDMIGCLNSRNHSFKNQTIRHNKQAGTHLFLFRDNLLFWDKLIFITHWCLLHICLYLDHTFIIRTNTNNDKIKHGLNKTSAHFQMFFIPSNVYFLIRFFELHWRFSDIFFSYMGLLGLNETSDETYTQNRICDFGSNQNIVFSIVFF